MAGTAAALDPGGCALWRRRARRLWLDGGHNPDGGRVAAAASAIWRSECRAARAVAGMLGTKDAQGFLANFAGLDP